MSYPIASPIRPTTFASSVTSMAVNLPPSIKSGDLLLAFVHVRNFGTWTLPSGWTELFTQGGGGSVGGMTAFYRIADGTESSSATWTASTGTTASWQVRRIKDWHGTTTPEEDTASGDASSANPPSVTASWGSALNLWLAVAGHSASSTAAFTAAPTDYIDFLNTGASSGGSAVSLAQAFREREIATEDPGTFTAGGSNRWWSAATVVIRPGSNTRETLYPNANGDTMQWTAEGGDYERVDETGLNDGDTTRLYTPTDNHVALFNFNNPSLAGTIHGVRVVAVVRGLDPVTQTDQVGVKIGGTEYWTSDITWNSTTYVELDNYWTTNPNTSAAWTWTNINDLQAGIKRIGGGGQALTQVRVEVIYTPGAPNSAPTIAPNSPSDAATITDTTPDIEFTGSDTDDNDLTYQIQIDTVNTFDSQPLTLIDNDFSTNTTGFTAHTGTWAIGSGVLQNTAAPGASWSDRIFLSNTTSYTDFEILVKVRKPSFNTQVIFRSGTTPNSGYGIQLRDTENFRLENWLTANLQQATPITWSTGTWYWVRIRTEGTNIKARVWADGDTEPGTWDINYTGSEFSSGGIGFSGESSSGTAEYSDLLVSSLTGDPLINALSASDAGFSNTETGGDSDPFNAGERIRYTVQAGDTLAEDVYYWRARVKDPLGSDTWSSYTTTRSFTVSSGIVARSNLTLLGVS